MIFRITTSRLDTIKENNYSQTHSLKLMMYVMSFYSEKHRFDFKGSWLPWLPIQHETLTRPQSSLLSPIDIKRGRRERRGSHPPRLATPNKGGKRDDWDRVSTEPRVNAGFIRSSFNKRFWRLIEVPVFIWSLAFIWIRPYITDSHFLFRMPKIKEIG